MTKALADCKEFPTVRIQVVRFREPGFPVPSPASPASGVAKGPSAGRIRHGEGDFPDCDPKIKAKAINCREDQPGTAKMSPSFSLVFPVDRSVLKLRNRKGGSEPRLVADFHQEKSISSIPVAIILGLTPRLSNPEKLAFRIHPERLDGRKIFSVS